MPPEKIGSLFQEILQTKTVSWQALENQQVYIWQKICLRYFKISQTYFRLSPLYFRLSAGSFLPRKKNIFFREEEILKPYKNSRPQGGRYPLQSSALLFQDFRKLFHALRGGFAQEAYTCGGVHVYLFGVDDVDRSA